MKAWVVRDLYDEYSTVVFAETRNKAKMAAMSTDCCEDMTYLQIRPIRFKDADAMYKGGFEMCWDDESDRVFLCNHGWQCVERDPFECSVCPAKTVCDGYKEDK